MAVAKGVQYIGRDGEDEEVDPREYLASAVCKVAGCEPATLRAWRRRNGLFPDTMMSGGWNRYSASDIAVTKLVVDLTKAGHAAQAAVDIAMLVLPVYEEFCSSRSIGDRQWFQDQHVLVEVGKQGKFNLRRLPCETTLKDLSGVVGPSFFLIITLSDLLPDDWINLIDWEEDRVERVVTITYKVPRVKVAKKARPVTRKKTKRKQGR
ncbi:hypothetical protein NB311A_07333 [Nitrobacter sp. Nb-311A]|jgi:hypothetical protein|uniref:MerR family transcriptional regulator n=1 Tax=Nitrobacter sp. Nb-311A TaxID=314253 RepID=UPI0000684C2D|nr:MerR family transcriptional regulator [Nitrobacter sp. Nb-311A]EAQ36943.1 hypothetical protein NB311A_07333 [Nitrobacter sp. Nb-311A]